MHIHLYCTIICILTIGDWLCWSCFYSKVMIDVNLYCLEKVKCMLIQEFELSTVKFHKSFQKMLNESFRRCWIAMTLYLSFQTSFQVLVLSTKPHARFSHASTFFASYPPAYVTALCSSQVKARSNVDGVLVISSGDSKAKISFSDTVCTVIYLVPTYRSVLAKSMTLEDLDSSARWKGTYPQLRQQLWCHVSEC